MSILDKNDLRAPRQEAVPLEWEGSEGLTETQQKAAQQLWALFANHYLLKASPAKSRYGRADRKRFNRILPAIDDARHSQVILIDGDRGSGKTALLITLIDAWNQAVRNQPPKPGFEDIWETGGRVIPIGLLDLRSLPNHTSLLIHISGLLRGVVEELGIHRATPPPPTSPHHCGTSDAQHAWQQFLNATASTEQRIRRRSAELDPETFAQELHETEQDRLHVGEMFGELLDHVVERLQERWSGERRHSGDKSDTPVFVIAIDDADMNPARMAECFELLNSFEHPRLVFILTGVSKLFISGLRAQFLGELRRPLANVRVGTAERERLGDLKEAFELAERYYDKLIPPSHRCSLPALPELERIGRLREELEAIPLGAGSVYTVFERVPVLGSLLPDTLRALEDFKFELRSRCGGSQAAPEFPAPEFPALEFLLLIKERLARQLGAKPEFDLDLLIPPMSLPLFGGTPALAISTAMLKLQFIPAKYTERTNERPHDRIALHHDESIAVTCRDPRSGNWLQLDHRIAHLLTLTEYVIPNIGTPHPRINAADLDASEHVLSREGLGQLSRSVLVAHWPRKTQWFGLWREMEFSRLWRRILDRIIGRPGASFTDDDLELLALNYVHAFAHAATTPFGTEDPDVDCPAADDRAMAWKAAIEHARNSEQWVSRWVDSEVLILAYPESGLSNDAARRLLSAWEANCEKPDRIFAEAEDVRRQSLYFQADERNSTLRTQIEEAFPGHPWTERAGAVVDDFRTRLDAALASIVLEPEDRPSWRPATSLGYIVQRTATLLSKAGPDVFESICNSLESYSPDSSNPLLALYRAWRASSPRDLGLLRWDQFTVSAARGPGLDALDAINERPVQSAVQGVEYLLYRGVISEPNDEAGSIAMFRLVYDAAADGRYNVNPKPIDWPLLQIYWRRRDQSTAPWPAVRWLAHIDYDIINEQWTHITDDSHGGQDSLGVVGRRYVEAQIHTYLERKVQGPDQAPMTWVELFEYARFAHDHEPELLARVRAFQGWISTLRNFGRPSAALPPEEAAAALVAYLDIIVPMSPAGRSWNVIAEEGFGPENPPAGLEGHPWLLLTEQPETHHQRRDLAAKLRARFEADAPEQFATPSTRCEAIVQLREALSSIALPAGPSLPNVDAYLTDDLHEILLTVYTGALTRVTEALGSSDTTSERLLTAWGTSQPDTPMAVGHDGQRWRLQGTFKIAYTSTQARASVGPLGIAYSLHRGSLENAVDEDLATVVHALIHDIAVDTEPTDETLAPVNWPLARATLGVHEYRSWPSVQWPARYDLRRQLESWWVDFDRRSQADKQSLSASMRNFVAATAHVYRTRTVYERIAGSWKDVVQAAWDAFNGRQNERSDRRLAYEAWFAQLPRLALPRAGLTDKHAADVLVRYVDLTGKDPRPELIGRVNDAGQQDLGIREQIVDHPAVILASCETDEQLAEAIETLRRRHELS